VSVRGAEAIDAVSLQRDLKAELQGEVRFDAGTRALYASDGSNFRQPPIGVVVPRTIDDVVAAHRVAREHRAPILPRGCGTSLSGEAVNHALVIDFSKHIDRILEVDADRRLLRCEPGTINDAVNEVAGKVGLMFGPDPSTHAYCTIGGNVGNNSCGVRSVHARMEGLGSRTSDNVAALEVLTYDGHRMPVGPTSDDELRRIIAGGGRRGQIYSDLRNLRDRYAGLIRERFVDIPRRVSGFNIDELLPEKGFNVARALVGTEGTCVTMLEATLQLVSRPKARSLLVIGYDEISSCADHVMEILEHRPMGCEVMDEELFRYGREMGFDRGDVPQLPDGSAWVLVEFGAETKEDAIGKARDLVARLKKAERALRGFSIVDDPKQVGRLWAMREGALSAATFPPDGQDYWGGWEDSAVPPPRVGTYVRDLRELLDTYRYRGPFYGHLGDGCIHTRINFDLRSADGVRNYRSFLEEAADLVVSYGGSLSGEHGDGQQRAELLPRMYGEELVQAFREFKRIWDPDGKMNPGKVVDPYRFDEDLKLGTDDNPWRPDVRFSYPEDRGDFAHAALRCVGVGKCRNPKGVDVMCPSFMVLREEKHTTRGRARLLFEMLEGDLVRDGWRSAEVEEALDLCLACKGCTRDCPVGVDMPTYKAEFLYHRWKGRVRPRHAFAFGFIDKAARLASRTPGLVNFLTRTPLLAQALKFAAGATQHRTIPSFAPLTLQAWFRERGERNVGGPKVILWPDTFNNHMHTDVGVAAVESLEAAGWHVVLPSGHVCCGRPLYDYGFLRAAERYLRRTLDVLRRDIRAGVPVVGLEPSCVATFKDELPKLLPHDDDAVRLAKQVRHFSEFFEEEQVEVPKLERTALLWVHCHHKATGGATSEQKLLERMGLDVEFVKGGCCGLAGSWGFEPAHYELSMQIGEQALLPRSRDAAGDTLIVADGFSCKSQIEHGETGRRALHVAQIMKLAREFGPRGPSLGTAPERYLYLNRPPAGRGRQLRRAGTLLALGAALSAAAWLSLRRLLRR
jgi:FAD/FMN-containing dehydrogenase/Fe-S oxidoreductase